MWLGCGLLVLLVVLGGVAVVLARRAEPFVRAFVVKGLQDYFHAHVELDGFHVSLGNGLEGRWGIWADGQGLRIWPPAQPAGQAQLESTESGEPLINLKEFHFHAPLHFEAGKPLHISVMRLTGLEIHVPPRVHGKPAVGAAGGAAPGGDVTAAGSAHPKNAGILTSVVIERVECDQANLILETDKPGKLPLGFAIAHLTLTNVTADGPVSFSAELTNPRPLGTIHTTGSFGPWQVADPGESPVSGDYRFEHADLGGFKGIAGILSSTGHYQGTLRNIVVDGVTDTPDFRLTQFGNAMALHTNFHAKVDGTDGDTWLDPVDATLGQSHFTARGQVVRIKPPDEPQGQPVTAADSEKLSPFRGGHDIALTVNVDRGRIEDFLRLASRSQAQLLTGAVTVKTTLDIPPGTRRVDERLALNGAFTLDQVRFSSAKIQDRIEELSLRGQGRPKEMKTADSTTVRSTMKGDFKMAGGVITLPALQYSVPGAQIDLSGTYAIEGGGLAFKGTAKLQATVSQMVGGWKGVLLKPFDRYLKKDGAGTEVPIHIEGTRDDPKFGIDFDRMKGSSAQRPGATQ